MQSKIRATNVLVSLKEHTPWQLDVTLYTKKMGDI
jgi:hypothetical protein